MLENSGKSRGIAENCELKLEIMPRESEQNLEKSIEVVNNTYLGNTSWYYIEEIFRPVLPSAISNGGPMLKSNHAV